MIIKEPPKPRDGISSVARLIRYMETAQESKGQKKDEERVLYSGAINMACDEMTAEMRPARIAEMYFLSKKNRMSKDPIYHRVLSFREKEHPTDEQCREAVQIFLDTCGLQDCQCVWATHKDTHCTHIHVCVNRIHPRTHRAVFVDFSKTQEQVAARKIEIAQGWEIERSGTLAKVVEKTDKLGNKRLEVVKPTLKERRAEKSVNQVISQAAQDHEYRTGEKSTERLIKERAADVLYTAIKKDSKMTWADVHSQLAELGMEIKPWRSGGIVVADGVSVTCSKIGQSLGWGKLQKVLGDFVPPSHKLDIKEIKKEIIATNDDDRKRKEEYSAARRKYYDEKSAAYDEFNDWRISTPKRLKEEHQQRRKELKESRPSWIGQGPELNALIHQLAARYAQEMAEYRAERDRRRKRLKELYGKKWPTYQGWQRGEWDDPSAMIIGVAVKIEIAPVAIAHYTSQVYISGKKGYVVYRDEQQRVSFVDRGDFISVNSWRSDPQSILAAMQLAAARWGKITLFGSDEYKAVAIDVALQNGITIKNPELQDQIAKRRVEIDKQKAVERVQKIKARAATRPDKTLDSYHRFKRLAERRVKLAKIWRDVIAAYHVFVSATDDSDKRQKFTLFTDVALEYIRADRRPITRIFADKTLGPIKYVSEMLCTAPTLAENNYGYFEVIMQDKSKVYLRGRNGSFYSIPQKDVETKINIGQYYRVGPVIRPYFDQSHTVRVFQNITQEQFLNPILTMTKDLPAKKHINGVYVQSLDYSNLTMILVESRNTYWRVDLNRIKWCGNGELAQGKIIVDLELSSDRQRLYGTAIDLPQHDSGEQQRAAILAQLNRDSKGHGLLD